MECRNCGAANNEGYAFCLNCGCPLTPQPTEEPQHPPVAETAILNTPTETTVPQYHEPIPAYTTPVDPMPVYVGYEPPVESEPVKPKKGKKLFVLIGAILAALVLVVVIAGLCTNWFGLNGPMVQIGSAASKTLSQYNFSADYEVEAAGMNITGVLYLDMDVEKEVVNAYLDATANGETLILAIYDDYLIYGSEDDLTCMDISVYISVVCDTIDEKLIPEMSFDEALDLLFDFIPNSTQEEINDEYIELTTLKKLIKSFFNKKLNNATWLKNNAGYSTSMSNGIKIHSFEPDAAEFLTASVEHFEDAFVDSSMYDDLMNAVELVDEYSDDIEIYAGFGIKGGKLVQIEAEVTYDASTIYAFCEFYDIGKTEVDEDFLEDLLDEADLNY